MNREEIIEYLDKPDLISYNATGQFELYSKLKYGCIKVSDSKLETLGDIIDYMDRVDEWFKGVIHSLYYRPNHTVLVLAGENQGDFFRDLFPQKEMFIDCHANYMVRDEFMYDYLCLELEFFKNTLNIPMEDNFIVRQNDITFAYADKRLASYCSTCEKWPYPKRKDYIVLNVVDIDWDTFNSIDKHLLWIEIFNKFKK